VGDGAFWEMHDLLYERQDQWSGNNDAPQLFIEMAGELGIDEAAFEACLTGGEYAAVVQEDFALGQADGVTGTPAFRINGAAVSGAQPFEAFQQQIDYFLAGGQPPTLEVAADSFRSLGDPNAPVVVTEFSDYQCPACSTVEQQVIPALIEQYVDTGKVRFVYREFPLPQLHPNATLASQAAYCAGQEDRYWDMHELLFAQQQQWGELADPAAQFVTYAQELGLDDEDFAACLTSDEAQVYVQGETMIGQELGVNATPFFFVGDLPIRGGLPIEELGQVIDYVADGGPPPNIVPQAPDWRVQGDMTSGSVRAVTVAFLNYADAQSAQHVEDVWPQIQESYVDSGKTIYVLHPWFDQLDTPAGYAAVAAVCADRQDSGWEMHETLFAEQESWVGADDVPAALAGIADELALDVDVFEACQDSGEARIEAQSDKIVALIYGVPGAPVFLFNNGQGEQGSPAFEQFQSILDSIVGP
jgi:protein-disulfide isomerase